MSHIFLINLTLENVHFYLWAAQTNSLIWLQTALD